MEHTQVSRRPCSSLIDTDLVLAQRSQCYPSANQRSETSDHSRQGPPNHQQGLCVFHMICLMIEIPCQHPDHKASGRVGYKWTFHSLKVPPEQQAAIT